MTPSKNQRLIQIFLRYPEPGLVKTRLAASIGETHTIALYKAFVADTLRAIASFPIKILYVDQTNESLMRKWLGDTYRYERQKGLDIGERMERACYTSFQEGATESLIIGSDIPGVNEYDILAGFDGLEYANMTIGPSFDGGYWLIGFREDGFHPLFFENIEWSMPHVYDDTMKIARGLKRTVAPLSLRRDIDTIHDLYRWYTDINENTKAENTRTYIEANKDVLFEGML